MPNDEELKSEIAKLKAENANLKAQRTGSLSLKVSEKGALSLYGIRRFPVTFYKDEWLKIIGEIENILHFINEHDQELKGK